MKTTELSPAEEALYTLVTQTLPSLREAIDSIELTRHGGLYRRILGHREELEEICRELEKAELAIAAGFAYEPDEMEVGYVS